VLLVVGGALATVLWQFSARLERTAVAVETLVVQVAEDRLDHEEFDTRLDEHDLSLANHEQRLGSLEKTKAAHPGD